MVIIAAGIFLLLYRLGLAPMSHDEAGFARKVASTWQHLFDVLAQDNHPLGYFLLLKVWVDLAGVSEWSVRFFSVPFTIATWVGFWLWCGRFLPPAPRLAALALLVFSPYVLFLGRLGKYYSLFGFLFLLCVWMLWELLEERDPEEPMYRSQVALFLASALGLVYTHYLGVVVWSAMGLLLLVRWLGEKRTDARNLLLLLSAAGLVYIPQVIALFMRLGIDDLRGTGTGDGLLRRIAIQFGYWGYSSVVGHTLEAAHVILVAMAAIAALVAVVGFAAGLPSTIPRARADHAARATVFCLYMMVFCSALGFMIMWLFLKDLPDMDYGERLAFLHPLLVLLAVRGMSRLPRAVIAAAAVLIAIPSAVSIANMLRVSENNKWEYLIPWREIRAQAAAHNVGPVLVISDSWNLGSRPWYYLRDIGDEHRDIRTELANANLTALVPVASMEANTVIYVRSVRDSSPFASVSRVEEDLRAEYGEPCFAQGYITDSPAMRRLKETIRRGSGVKTMDYKIELLVFCRDPALPQ